VELTAELSIYKYTCILLPTGWHGYIKWYYSSNLIPEEKVEYLGMETEKTATMGKNRYDVTDSSILETLKDGNATKNRSV